MLYSLLLPLPSLSSVFSKHTKQITKKNVTLTPGTRKVKKRNKIFFVTVMVTIIVEGWAEGVRVLDRD